MHSNRKVRGQKVPNPRSIRVGDRLTQSLADLPIEKMIDYYYKESLVLLDQRKTQVLHQVIIEVQDDYPGIVCPQSHPLVQLRCLRTERQTE